MQTVYPDLYVPEDYAERFYNVNLMYLYGTVKSLKNKRLESLFRDFSGVLREGTPE